MKKYQTPELNKFVFNVYMDAIGASTSTPEDAVNDPWSTGTL